MRILVTGAAGFIGSHVAEAYQAAGHDVVAVDNLSTGKRENLPPDFPFQKLDLLDAGGLEKLFREFQPEVVSHHAAQVNVRVSWDQPVEDARTNILGTLTLLQQAVRWQTQKVIYSSSAGAIYGEPTALPVTEDYPPRPLSNYGVSKYAAELYLQAFHASSGLGYIILRYPNVYGPRQDPTGEAGVVAIFTTQLLQGIQPRIYGDGSKTRDYVYIDDIVEANLRVLPYEKCGVFNLGWGRETTDMDVFLTVREAVGSAAEPRLEKKRPGELDHICLDATRARNLLQWKPRMDFRTGVQQVVAHWKDKL
jgi:UDP-glucose 4-epimerase